MNLYDDFQDGIAMQKFYNNECTMMDDAISGFVKAHANNVAYAGDKRALIYRGNNQKKVGIAVGGGAGHDPAFMGFLGENMVDSVAIGDIFKPPSKEAFYHAIYEAEKGMGVLCLCGNYIKDIKNVELAAEEIRKLGRVVHILIINDDIVEQHEGDGKRGSTGEILVWKIAGAAAGNKNTIEEIIEISKAAISKIYSMGVGLASCIIPDLGRVNYLIEKGTMEIGVGHHGHSSVDTMKIKCADVIVDKLLGEILKAANKKPCDCAVMISGLGNTMQSELHIIYSRVHDVLISKGFCIYKSYIGNFFTSLDMMGATITVFFLTDELKKLLDVESYPLAFSMFNPFVQL